MEILEEREGAGFATVLFGIVTLVASLAADSIGLGGGGEFGPDQMAGTLLGVVAIGIGWILMRSDA